MKKIILLLGLLVMLSTSTFAVISSMPSLNVSLMNQDPDPVGPGQYVDLRFMIQNNGEPLAEAVQVELLDTFPFSVDRSEDPLRTLGTVLPTGGSRNVFVVKYKVRVSEDAIEGPNDVKVRYKVGDSPWITERFSIDVQTIDATLSIEKVETIPSKIKPGDSAKVRITVKNMADSVMRDVGLKLDLTFSTIVEPASMATGAAAGVAVMYTTLPFAPLGSATEKKVKMIKDNDEVVFEYDIIAYSDAQAQVYKIPIQLTYRDELETAYSVNDIIGVVVGTKPDVSVGIDETDLSLDNKGGTVVIKFINKGFTDVKFLDVWLGESEEYRIIGSNEVYIGNVDSDDFETAEFKLFIEGEQSDKTADIREIKLPLQVKYRDANNVAYEDEIDLNLDLLSSKYTGNGKSSGLTTVIIVIVIAGIAFFAYRRIRKKKE